MNTAISGRRGIWPGASSGWRWRVPGQRPRLGPVPRPGRRRPTAWVGRALALAPAYHGLLVLLAVLRFGFWPNYLKVNPYGWQWRLAASWRDAVALVFTEPLIELGHRFSDLGATEWQITLDPLGLPVILAAALLVSAFSRCRPESRAGVTARFSATLGWVACHTAPGWVLMLMSETNSGLALMAGALLRRAGRGPPLRSMPAPDGKGFDEPPSRQRGRNAAVPSRRIWSTSSNSQSM